MDPRCCPRLRGTILELCALGLVGFSFAKAPVVQESKGLLSISQQFFQETDAMKSLHPDSFPLSHLTRKGHQVAVGRWGGMCIADEASNADSKYGFHICNVHQSRVTNDFSLACYLFKYISNTTLVRTVLTKWIRRRCGGRREVLVSTPLKGGLFAPRKKDQRRSFEALRIKSQEEPSL